MPATSGAPRGAAPEGALGASGAGDSEAPVGGVGPGAKTWPFQQKHKRLSRECLLSRGLTPAEVDQCMVRQHEVEVLEEMLACWIVCFGYVCVVLMMIGFGLMVYLLFALVHYRRTDCDMGKRLHDWAIVVIVFFICSVPFCGTSVYHNLFSAFCCHDKTRPGAPPCRVQCPQLTMSLFIFCWLCVGMSWALSSENCHREAPDLYLSVLLYSIFGLLNAFILTVSVLGLWEIAASLHRRKLLPRAMIRKTQGAPDGTLEQHETVLFVAATFGDGAQCPRCSNKFSADHSIKKTACGHCFHEDCLASWLIVCPNCPLCRVSLVRGSGNLSLRPTGRTPSTVGAVAETNQGPDVEAPRATSAPAVEAPRTASASRATL